MDGNYIHGVAYFTLQAAEKVTAGLTSVLQIMVWEGKKWKLRLSRCIVSNVEQRKH